MNSKSDVTSLPGAGPLRTARVQSDGNGATGGNAHALSEAEAHASVRDLEIEDGQPVESVFVEKQQRLLTEPLYSSWAGPGGDRPFLALSNVGLFPEQGQPALVPDMMLSLDVPQNADLTRKENRSYFEWIVGKVPEVVIEIVSDRRGGEDSHKRTAYARMGVRYYVIFDPGLHLDAGVLRAFDLHQGNYEPLAAVWFPEVGLGLMLWTGAFEGQEGTWLRWCDANGQPVATGWERAEQERRDKETAQAQAEQERRRAEELAARLRALGVDPEEA